MEIRSVVMRTKDLMQMRNFYINTLGFSLVSEDENYFRITIGTSEIEFTSKGVAGNPYYHFAFNIPANKFTEAKSWIKEKVTLTVEDGEDEAEFGHSSAHALYFYDPAGNIVELISRHATSMESIDPFSIKSILNISEISFTVNDAIVASEQLKTIGVKERDNNEISTKYLNFMGERANGVFILLSQPGRRWIFSDKKSAVYPIEIVLTNNYNVIIDSNNELYIRKPFKSV